MAPHSSTLAWKIPWIEEPGGLQSMGSLRVRHDWATSLFTFMHWRRKWQPTLVFLPGASQGRDILVGCRLRGHRVGHDWSDSAAAAHASSVMLKILQARLHNTWTVNFLMFKLVLEKAEEPEIKLPTSAGSWKKPESSRNTSISALLTMPKPLTVWITTHCGKFFKRWEYQTTWPASWEICMQVRKQQLELDMEQQTGSK